VYCPKCNLESDADPFPSLCAVCGTILAASRTVESEGETWVDVLKTTDIALLMVIQSVLRSADIPFMVQGEEGLRVLPLNSGGFFNTSAYGAVVRVKSRDLDDARRVLEEAVPASDDGEKYGS
jgi:hypothetical protein